MKYGRPILTLLIAIGMFLYFQSTYTRDKQVEKQQLKLQSSITTLSGQYVTLQEQLSGVTYQLKDAHQKLSILNTLDSSKPVIEGKKDTQVCTNGFAKCIDPTGIVTYKDVCYESYNFQENGQVFAGYSGAYNNKDEQCLIYWSEEELKYQLGE